MLSLSRDGSRSTKIRRSNLMLPNGITSNDRSGYPAFVAADGGGVLRRSPFLLARTSRGRAGPGRV
jgi:hypothetical protein